MYSYLVLSKYKVNISLERQIKPGYLTHQMESLTRRVDKNRLSDPSRRIRL